MCIYIYTHMVIYPWYHWLYIYIGIGITNPLVWLVLPWAPEAKLAILRAHPAEVAGSSWGLVRCKEEVPDQRDKFEQFWKWCMCFWSFYTSWWFVAIDFDSCGLCRSKTGKVLSHRLHQAIVYLSTGVKAPMFQDAREPKKKTLCSTGFPCSLSHSATACDVLDCATYVRDLFQRVVIDAMTNPTDSCVLGLHQK